MVKFYMNMPQMHRLYKHLLKEDFKDSVVSSSFWFNGFSMTLKDDNCDCQFQFLQHNAMIDDFYYVKGDCPNIESVILKVIHSKGSSGEEDWSVAFD